jgi:hypothetical protein
VTSEWQAEADAASVYRCTTTKQEGTEWPDQGGVCGDCV